jgi:alcohol dehydrogenase YqhD (iron-dependent ADH family)
MVLRRALHADPGRDGVLARIFDVPLDQSPAFLDDFLARLGVSTRFADYGVGADEEQRMITAALDGVRGKNFIGAQARSAA